PWVAFVVLPVFALANAGIPIGEGQFDRTVGSAVFFGLVAGKPVGVVLFSLLAVRLRLARLPPSLRWSVLAGGSLLTGIGFTMATFIAELALAPTVLGSAKLGILVASIVSGVAGLFTLAWLTA